MEFNGKPLILTSFLFSVIFINPILCSSLNFATQSYNRSVNVLDCCLRNNIPGHCIQLCDGKNEKFYGKEICIGAYDNTRIYCVQLKLKEEERKRQEAKHRANVDFDWMAKDNDGNGETWTAFGKWPRSDGGENVINDQTPDYYDANRSRGSPSAGNQISLSIEFETSEGQAVVGDKESSAYSFISPSNQQIVMHLVSSLTVLIGLKLLS